MPHKCWLRRVLQTCPSPASRPRRTGRTPRTACAACASAAWSRQVQGRRAAHDALPQWSWRMPLLTSTRLALQMMARRANAGAEDSPDSPRQPYMVMPHGRPRTHVVAAVYEVHNRFKPANLCGDETESIIHESPAILRVVPRPCGRDDHGKTTSDLQNPPHFRHRLE